MELNCLELFMKTLSGININTVIFRKDCSNLELVDNRFRMHLYENYPYGSTLSLSSQKIKKNTLVCKTDEFSHTYFFLRIPEEFLSEEDTDFMSIGPFLSRRKSHGEICQIMQDNALPERLLNDVSAFYDSLPVVDNLPAFQNVILQLAAGLFGTEYHFDYLPEDSVLFLGSGKIYNTVKDNPQMARDSIAERYEVENELMAAISAGDYDRAHELHGRFIKYHIRPRAKSPLRNQQHLSIILNTLCRKAAEAGGVHPLYIDDLSTRFAVLINEVNSLTGISALPGEMIHKYCLLVKNHAMKGYSAVTKEIISYIDFHYTEDLNLNFFAKMFNISKTYLSNLFRKETGSTLTEFIHQVRMRKAITLINSSALPITAIATACGYNDINYFIRIFKRTYGLSPKQYQKTIMHAGH